MSTINMYTTNVTMIYARNIYIKKVTINIQLKN